MIYLNKDKELNIELLGKMITHFRTNVEPQLRKYKNYYDGKQDILNKDFKNNDSSVVVINTTKSIADAYCGYLATPNYISYRSEQDIEDIMQILRYNDYQTEDSEYLLNALVYGTAAELMYIDATGQTRFRLINPTTCFGIYDDSLTGDLMYFVRMYKASEWDNSNTYYVDVYSDYDIKHYKMSGSNGGLEYMSAEPHYFSQCPANIFTLPDERSIFDCILTLQDALNEVMTSEILDFSSFCDAYMILQGVDADSEDIEQMRKDRAAAIPADANISYLTKNTNDVQVENILKRLQDSIYRIAACPDFSSETFVGGVSSGVAIRFKLSGIEFRAGKIEAEMKKALQRRVEIICGIASLKLGEAVYRDIQIDFKRNIPEDLTATIGMVNALKGSVSDATLLGQLPFVTDVNAELEAVQEQKAANMAMYSFGAPAADDE